MANWYAHHIEIMHQMIRDDFAQYPDDRSLSTYGVDAINGVFKEFSQGGKFDTIADSTFERFIGYEACESKPSTKNLQLIFSYFKKNKTSNFNSLALIVDNWFGFVKYIDETFTQPVFKKQLPPTYNRGKESVDLSEFNEWLKECKKTIQEIVLPTIKSVTKQGISEAKLETYKEKQEDYSIHGFIYLDDKYWQQLLIESDKEQINLLKRYYTHIDSKLIPKAVAANDYIIAPQDVFHVTDSENNKEEKTITQVLEQAISESFSLVMILGDGGIGKSTFLFWVGRMYYSICNTFYISSISQNTLDTLIKACLKISETRSNPILILIDDIAEYEKARKISDFISKIKEALSKTSQITVIVAERKSRYNYQIGYNKLDIHFSGRVQSVDYAPPNKAKIFSRIYSLLSKTNEQLNNENLRVTCENIFLDVKVYSISESIFRLLNYLKIKSKIAYDFDWDDWDRFIKNNTEYQPIENLFIAVTCFYQFGIMMPINYQCPSLQGANRVQIRKAINSFGIETSPIRLTEDNKEEDTRLFLKHEYVSTWFLYDENRRSLVKDFFKDFITSINTNEAGWLLRQFRKILKSPDFLASGFQDYLDEEKYLSLIDSYIQKPTISELERTKMQMEKGIVLMQKGDEKGAMEIFQSIAENDLSNNHARDQLARIYRKSAATYQLAFDNYLEIFKNGALYAITQIYKVLRLCRKNGVSINYQNNSDFTAENISAIADKLSPYEYHETIKEFILSVEFELAEQLLDKIEIPQNITADCYNMLANAINFSNETIDKKTALFLKAIEIDAALNPEKENFQFTIDYAVFLYRIRKFPYSLEVIKAFTVKVDDDLKEHIENTYWNIVRSTKKLFFAEIPDVPTEDSLRELELFLFKQSKEAAALVSLKQKNIDNIIKGYLILKTVMFHSEIRLPNVYNNAAKLMAYCYMQNAEKKWNNLPTTENRLIAEKLYDQLLDAGYFLDKNDCAYLLKNLLNFKDKEKSTKVISLANVFLENFENRKFSIFYRYRGNAKKYVEDYNGAMVDYQTALERCTRRNYESDKDYRNDKCYLLNNIALLICDCFEIGKPFKKYSLQNALDYCTQSLELRPDLLPLQETKVRIEMLLRGNSN